MRRRSTGTKKPWMVGCVGGWWQSESVAGCSQAVSDGQGLRLGHAVHITCIHTPGCATDREREDTRRHL